MADFRIARLLEKYSLWKREVIRLSQKVELVLLTDSSDRINGKSLDDLKNTISTEVRDHEDDTANPHRLTLAQILGLSKAGIAALFNSKIYRRDFPVTRGKASDFVGENTGDNTYLIKSGIVGIRGYSIPITDTEVEVRDNVLRQYIKIRIEVTQLESFTKTAYTIFSDSDKNRLPTEEIIAVIDWTSVGVYTVTFLNYITFDGYRVDVTPNGKTIPASTGNNSGSGAVANEWF